MPKGKPLSGKRAPRKPRTYSSKYDVAHYMPPLEHYNGVGAFDVFASEVIRWAIQQPELLQVLFDALTGAGHGRHIVYDTELQKWRGKLWQP
jgi:hypothetical protein